MKKLLTTISLSLFGITAQKVIAQQSFATLEKNRNYRVKNLEHKLNKTSDTLELKSDKNIDFVYALNKHIKREIDYTVFAKEFKVPLRQLTRGKHIFVVEQNRKKIVFVVRVNGDNLKEELKKETIKVASFKLD